MRKWVILMVIAAVIISYAAIYRIEKSNFSGVALLLDYKFNFSIPFKELQLPFEGSSISLVQFEAKHPKGIIYFLHGGGGNLATSDRVAKLFVKAGYTVVAVDYPGYGKTTVEPNQKSWFSVVQAGYNYVKKNYPETRIIIYGRSLGCAMATQLASQNRSDRLILGSPVYERGGLATQLPPALAWLFRAIYPTSIQHEFSTRRYIAKVRCRVVIFCGSQDGDCTDSNKLLQTTNPNKVSITVIPNTNHASIVENTVYQDKLVNSVSR